MTMFRAPHSPRTARANPSPIRHRRLPPATYLPAALAAPLLLAAAPAARAQGEVVGKLSISREVRITRGLGGVPGAVYVPAQEGQLVFAGQGLRVLKRSRAEVSFRDKSVLRVNEQTDLVIQDAGNLRRLRLQSGAIWVRVAKGIATQVETPAATAVARGTEFVVSQSSDGSLTTLTVLEGTVEMQAGGKTVTVQPGQTVTVRGGLLPDTASRTPSYRLPFEYGGVVTDAWWNDIEAERGTAVTAGSPAILALRTSLAGESEQNVAAATALATPDTVTPPPPPLDAAQQNRLLAIARGSLVPDVNGTNLSLAGYRGQFGSQALGRFNLNADDAAFLQGIGVGTVGQFLDAVTANSASLNVGLPSRAFYRPGTLRDTPNFDFRLLDRNESSGALLGIGAAAGLLGTLLSKSPVRVPVPRFELSGFGYAADPSLTGARARVDGRVGNTRYAFESNYVRVMNRDFKGDYSQAFSVASVEQTVAPGIDLFAGRRRFYHGPVFQNQSLSQLIADRYSAAGATIRRGPFAFEGAFVHDTNPAVRGAQRGALASAFYRPPTGGGKFGIHYLRVPKVSDGTGLTASASFPLAPSLLDFYGEAGRGPDGASLQTYGVYFPGLYQVTDIDLFVEYGYHEGVSRSFSFIANKQAGRNLSFRSFLSVLGDDDVRGGLAAVARFGN